MGLMTESRCFDVSLLGLLSSSVLDVGCWSLLCSFPQPRMKANLCHSRSFFKWELVAGLRWPAAPLPPPLPSICPLTPPHQPPLPHKWPRLPRNKLDSHRSPSICVTPGIPWTKLPSPHHPQQLCIIKARKTACKVSATALVTELKDIKTSGKQEDKAERKTEGEKERLMIKG